MTVDTTLLRALLAAATPGEWRHNDEDGSINSFYKGAHPENVMFARGARIACDPPDAALICASVNALPALLAVFEAACALRDAIGGVPWIEINPTAVAVIKAVDAARKAGA